MSKFIFQGGQYISGRTATTPRSDPWLRHCVSGGRFYASDVSCLICPFLMSCCTTILIQADCKVNKGNLQLVGVTAMLLASKIEEMFTPEIGDFVYITDNAYTAAMIRSLESKMATLLNYNFGDPLCIHFLRRNSKAAKVRSTENERSAYVTKCYTMI